MDHRNINFEFVSEENMNINIYPNIGTIITDKHTIMGKCSKCEKMTKLYPCIGEWCAGPTCSYLCWSCAK